MKKSKYLKSVKGASSVEFVIALTVFIFLFSFMFDLILLSYKQFAISTEANKLIRVLTVQSGTSSSMPSNYPGSYANYMNPTQMYDRITRKFDNLGIKKQDFTVKIKTQNDNGTEKIIVLPNSSGIKSDYKAYITIEINYKYKWNLWSQLIPGELKGEHTISRSGYSEYKNYYDKWENE